MLSEVANFINSKVSSANAKHEAREAGNDVIFVDPAAILEVCKALKNSDYDYNVLQVMTGTDFPQDNQLEVSYIINSFTKNHAEELILKTRVPRDNPELDSVTSVWRSADWLERECYDMVGVKFNNHPDFRRILCPDDWEGYPLRRDYKAAEKYNNMTIYPEAKMNIPDRGFAAKLKEQEKSARQPEASK